MKGYAATDMFTGEELSLWSMATELVAKVGDPDTADPVRCHELARAVARALNLEVVDGKFGAVEHSWIKLSHRRVLDVYVPGAVPMVQLVDLFWGLPYTDAYKEGEPRTDIDEERVHKLYLSMVP